MTKLFVRCCENNKVKSSVYLDVSDDPCFRFTDSDDPCEYCPWCGVLLDINLDMAPTEEA